MSPTDTPVPVKDASQYIRTYAKDFVALSGKELPEDPKSIKNLEKIEKEREKEKARELPPPPRVTDTSILEQQTEQSLMLSPEDEDKEYLAHEQTEKETVLARLRAKVEAHQDEPQSTPFISSILTSPSAAPSQAIDSEIGKDKEPVRIRSTNIQPPPAPSASSPLHTYTSDFADRIDEKKASTFSVLAAEKDAKPQKIKTAPKKIKWVPIVVGVLLIVLGGGGAAAAYYYMTTQAPVTLLPSAPSLITPDSRVKISGSGADLQQALANEANQVIPQNSVVLTYISVSTTTSKGATVSTPQTGGALLDALALPAPDILLRNIDPSTTIGVVHAGEETKPFFILRISSYERTFAGMLEWEATMPQDLAVVYPAYPTGSAIPAGGGQFVDEVVDSHNARVLKDGAGNTVLIYGYADPQTLIIARDESAFTLLIGRLQASAQ